jgi:asparagine synthase (glutamine-hydrolysing)
MCGICGIVSLNSHIVKQESIRKMMQIQKHRGPDDEGIFIEDGVGLGFVRLSILDLSLAGHQPMISSDENYVMVFNGEIFNYIEIREELIQSGHNFKSNSDSEVLLAAYQQWGENCLHKLNGMWAFLIYNRKDKIIFASRDRYGIKPLYYYKTDGILAFSSEIKPLLSLLPGKPDPDYQSVFDYMVFNRTDQTCNTFFCGIKKLQHGQNLTLQINPDQKVQDIKLKKWYDLKEQVSYNKGINSPEEFRDLFSSSIRLRLRSDVPVGVCLSGGLDSSSIAAIIHEQFGLQGLKTFSATYGKGVYGDESEYINEFIPILKNMFFTNPGSGSLLNDLHTFIRIHEEPVPSTGPYAQYKVMELARNNVVVTLDGQGADELLAGYHYFFGYYFKDLVLQLRLFKLIRELFGYLTLHKSFYGIKTFVYFLLPAWLKTQARINEKGFLCKSFALKYKHTNSISENLYGSNSLRDALIKHFEFKLEHLLKWEDRNSMWFSIEARVPFLDHRLVERTLASSSELFIKNGITKSVLRESMTGILPEKIRTRKDKMGFGTPQGEWFRDELFQKLIKGIIMSESFRNRGVIDPEKAMVLYKKHLMKRIDISKDIWKWINIELWFREYIDEQRD